ncbi:MAG: NifB/NifX family molybdenum-iron cluster-binding protein, partial [Anaerolineae bacterium]
LLHYEPRVRTHLRYAVPLADVAGTISDHFGEAPFFGLVTVRIADDQNHSELGRAVERQEVVANPHASVEKAKGIRVGEWLVGLKADVVLLRESVQGKGPAYVLADAGVETRLTGAQTLTAGIAEQIEERET